MFLSYSESSSESSGIGNLQMRVFGYRMWCMELGNSEMQGI